MVKTYNVCMIFFFLAIKCLFFSSKSFKNFQLIDKFNKILFEETIFF